MSVSVWNELFCLLSTTMGLQHIRNIFLLSFLTTLANAAAEMQIQRDQHFILAFFYHFKELNHVYISRASNPEFWWSIFFLVSSFLCGSGLHALRKRARDCVGEWHQGVFLGVFIKLAQYVSLVSNLPVLLSCRAAEK